MTQQRLLQKALLAKANRRGPVGRPRTRWINYIENLGWNRSGLHASEMLVVMEDRTCLVVSSNLMFLLIWKPGEKLKPLHPPFA